MRVISAFKRAVRALAVSADGRFLAAADTGGEVVVWDWATGAECHRVHQSYTAAQLAFAPNAAWLAVGGTGAIDIFSPGQRHRLDIRPGLEHTFSGGLAFAPDGRQFVASEIIAWRTEHRLARWTVPTWKPTDGFDYWPAFTRLAFSPDGQYLGGINGTRFELRIAVTGGLNGRQRWMPRKRKLKLRDDTVIEVDETASESLFLTFSRDSQTLAAGWDEEFYVLDTVNGHHRRRVPLPGEPVTDAAFTGSGRHLGTVHGTGELRLWDAEAWQVARAYDWRAGPLTRVAFTADGLAGVCGTASGGLVLFDLDE